MTRYVHADDWENDACPKFPETPPPGTFYPPNTKRCHYIPGVHDVFYPPGDRLKYMTCENCGAVIWGHYEITEVPW